MHRLETVTRVRERPRHDHAHGVIEVAALHLLRDGNGANVRGRLRAVGRGIVGVRQGLKILRIQRRFP
jgi:hypothetical protein